MASAVVGSFLLPQPATLCPSPLHIQKKRHRTTIRRRMLRKSPNAQSYRVHGPLDDIIDEIKSDIWESPSDYGIHSSFFDWANPLKAPPMWTATPLPLSRAPSDQPLTIRKNRNSRSSASGSSTGDVMSYSRSNSQDEAMNGGAVGVHLVPGAIPWPSFDTTTSHESAHYTNPSSNTIFTGLATAQQSLENPIERTEGRSEAMKQRRPSRLRLFTNGFSRLRRTTTGETSASTGDASESTSPTTTTSHVNPEEANNGQEGNEPSDDAVEAYMKRNVHNCTRLRAMMERMADQLPAPVEDEHESRRNQVQDTGAMPTTLRAAIRIFPQVKILREDLQDFSIAIEVEGVLHNRSILANATVDVIFIIDNGYYVTRECLEKATDAVNGAIYHLRRGDRVALYTTHCAHNSVTGNKPELHYPIRPFGTDSGEILQDLTTSICRCGTQAWEPARPNPSMTEAILSVARSLNDQDLKESRAHIILLSPAACVLHDVSKTFPDLYIHRINPAALPYRREPELQDTVCFELCCKNIFVSNWSSYQSVSGRIKRILKNARSKNPVGELTNISIDLRTKEGCELIECCGRKDISHLRLGQVHTFFARIRIKRGKTQCVDLDSINPIFNSSLDFQGLRQELQNAATLGAIKVHVLDIQAYHRNSIHNPDCWNYNEAPFMIIRELGGLAPPVDTALEVYKRQYFHKFVQLTIDEAKVEADNLLAILDVENELARKVLERMATEIRFQEEIRKYERNYRQKLPLCPGPIEIEPCHEWLLDIWNKRKTKRNGVAGGAAEVSGLIGSFHAMKRLT